LIIAALYLPAAAYLSNQVRQTLLQGSDEELKKDPSSWLIENNMVFSPLAAAIIIGGLVSSTLLNLLLLPLMLLKYGTFKTTH
jgi:hypothetical protein